MTIGNFLICTLYLRIWGCVCQYVMILFAFSILVMIKACENKIKEVYACKLALSDFWHWNYPIEKQRKVIHVLHFAWFNLFFNMGFQIAPYNLMLIVFFTQRNYMQPIIIMLCVEKPCMVYSKRRYFLSIVHMGHESLRAIAFW